MQRSIAVRIAIADADVRYRATLSAALREAECWVVECADGPSLAEVIETHARARRALDALVVDGFLCAGGVVDLNHYGVFDAGAPVIVTLEPKHAALAKQAAAAGAAMVLTRSDDPSGVVRAVRHVVHRDRRWPGGWVSAGALVRSDAAGDSNGRNEES